MAIQEIFLDFDSADNPVVSVKGVRGKACKDLTADLESKLGTVTKEEHTAEYNKTEVKNATRVHSRS